MTQFRLNQKHIYQKINRLKPYPTVRLSNSFWEFSTVQSTLHNNVIEIGSVKLPFKNHAGKLKNQGGKKKKQR